MDCFDYRRVNSRTVRAVYYLRTADSVKGECVGSVCFSLFDAASGLNQVRNTPRAKPILAVLSASGCCLPDCLPRGPMKGPEDFARVVDTLFAMGKARVRRVNREWQVYVGAFCARTGKWRGGKAYSDEEYDRQITAASLQGQAHHPAAEEARHRLSKLARPPEKGEEAKQGLGMTVSGTPTDGIGMACLVRFATSPLCRVALVSYRKR